MQPLTTTRTIFNAGWEPSTPSRTFTASAISNLPRRGKFEALFESIDTNKDGVLTLDEVYAAVDSNKLGLSRAEAKALFTELDINGDGVLSSGYHHPSLFRSEQCGLVGTEHIAHGQERMHGQEF